jgi:hypothetical protein
MATQYQNYKENLVSVGGNATLSVPTGAANTVITASVSRLCRIVVTTAGTGAGNVQFFDNATTNSGTVLFALPATVAVAQFYDVQMPAVNGIVCQNVVNGPVLTVSFL